MAFFLKNLVCISPHLCFLPSLLFAWEFSTYCEFGKYFVSYMGSIKNNKYFLFYLLILLPLQRYKGIL